MRKLTVLWFIGALFISACGSGDSAADTVAAVSDDAERPASFDDLEVDAPINEFLGFDFGSSDRIDEQFAAMERVSVEVTTKCMLDKGFQYIAPDFGQLQLAGAGAAGEPPFFSKEWIDKYGLGITTQRFPQSMVGSDLVGFPDEIGSESGEFVDPNADYLASLTEGERAAYDEALYGAGLDETSVDTSSLTTESAGCAGEGFAAIEQSGLFGFYDEFGDELEALEERVNADPRVVAYNKRVGDCVAERGLEWISVDEVFSRFEAKLAAIEPPLGADGPPTLDPTAKAELAKLQAEEVALATVVVACDGGPLNEQFFVGDIRAEYEREFLDTNADAVAKYQAN